MLPGNNISSITQYAPFLDADKLPTNNLLDYEMGGIALNDGTKGLNFQLWTLRLTGNNVIISANTVSPTTLFSGTHITEISLTFDQNMNPVVAYVQSGQPKLYWFDSLVNLQVLTDLDPTIRTPRVCMDDKRRLTTQLGQNDAILGYIRNNNLYYCQQRERYTVERLLASNVRGRLVKIGMNKGNRLQFMIKKY
jgi:hypothetical protein